MHKEPWIKDQSTRMVCARGNASAPIRASTTYLDNPYKVWGGRARLEHVEECHKHHRDRHLMEQAETALLELSIFKPFYMCIPYKPASFRQKGRASVQQEEQASKEQSAPHSYT